MTMLGTRISPHAASSYSCINLGPNGQLELLVSSSVLKYWRAYDANSICMTNFTSGGLIMALF